MKSPAELRKIAERTRKKNELAEYRRKERLAKEKHERAEKALPELRKRLEEEIEQAARQGRDSLGFSVMTMGSPEQDYKDQSAAMYLLFEELVKEDNGFSISWPTSDYDTGVGSDPGPPISTTSMWISWK